MSVNTAVATFVAENRRTIITWMIIVSCLGGLLAIVVPIGFLFWLDDQQKQGAVAEKDLAAKAGAVLVIDTLPQGYRFETPAFAISRANSGAVLLVDDNNDTSVYFERKPAAKLAEVEKRMNTTGGLGDHFTAKERGELPVAGKTLTYVRGISQRDAGGVYNELRGYVTVSPETIVEVATGTPEARPFDLARFKELLASIKSLKP